jgi:hypothetical protein
MRSEEALATRHTSPPRRPTAPVVPELQGELDEAPLEVKPRTTVSVRLTLGLQDRLRAAAFHTRRRQQSIVEAALDEWLRKRGY